MIKVLVKHASKVFSELPEEKQLPKRRNQKERFLERLTQRVQSPGIFKYRSSMSILDKTAEGYIAEFCKKGLLYHEKKDHYINLMIQEAKDV